MGGWIRPQRTVVGHAPVPGVMRGCGDAGQCATGDHEEDMRIVKGDTHPSVHWLLYPLFHPA